MRYICYYRVSTRKQGNSGLGLEGQKDAVKNYLANKPHKIVEEFTEIESGRKSKRPELTAALKACKKRNAILLVARTDRLSRNVHFLSGLMEQKVEFVCCDNPTATNFTLHIYAAIAQEESRMISIRTKAALKAAKRRGIELGKHGKVLAAMNKDNADTFADDLSKALVDAVKLCWKRHGKPSYAKIADILNRKRIKTFRSGKFYASTVSNYCKRLDVDIHAVA